MIGGTSVLVQVYQAWARHQGNQNPVAVDNMMRFRWERMMQQLARLRDVILERGQNHYELPGWLMPRMSENLFELNNLLNLFIGIK